MALGIAREPLTYTPDTLMQVRFVSFPAESLSFCASCVGRGRTLCSCGTVHVPRDVCSEGIRVVNEPEKGCKGLWRVSKPISWTERGLQHCAFGIPPVTRHPIVWCGTVRCGTVRCGTVRCGKVHVSDV